jgi:excisionase family DNA binding protein
VSGGAPNGGLPNLDGLAERVAELVAERVRVPPIAYTVSEACAALGVSWDYWREHVEPGVRVVRRGRRKLVPVSELAAWLDRNAERAL